MNNNHSLSELAAGSAATVTALRTGGAMRRRLQDLGLVEGSVVACVGKSPAGDPSAYLVRGAVIALRADDADGVLIQESLEGAAAGSVQDASSE